MSTTTPNSRLPYLRLYMIDHAARVARLPLAVRGMLDLVRCELWTVEGFILPRDQLERRLMVLPNTPEAAHIQTLIDACLLQVDEQGRVYDQVLTRARDEAIEQAQAKRAAANKRWAQQGAATRSSQPATPGPGDF